LRYVIDASVVLKWLLPESDSVLADRLLETYLNNEIELIAPDLLMLEVANALWKRVTRQDVSEREATGAYRDLMTLPLPLVSSSSLGAKALELSLKHQHSVYDLVYCALAIEKRCKFVTADQVLVNKLQPVLPFIQHISSAGL
jgi:predicted nucleic acid-binding protein